MRKWLAALLLLLSLSPVAAQVCAPVPALPDTERRTQLSLSAQTGPFSVGFAIYGDSTDYVDWVGVYVNGVLQPSSAYTLASVSGPIGTLCRPITNATITFGAATTGTVQIVGARRPRRASQFNENRGVTGRDLNQVVTDLMAITREGWDKTARTIMAPPGETLSLLPLAAQRANGVLAFNGSGDAIVGFSIGNVNVSGAMIPFVTAGSLSAARAILGVPGLSGSFTAGHVAVFSNTSGDIIDGGPPYNAATANRDYYVAIGGTDAPNITCSFGLPCATGQYAFNLIRTSSWAGFTPTIRFIDTGATTNFDQEIVVSGPIQGATTVQIYGNEADASRVVLRCTANNSSVVTANDYGGITLHAMTINGGAFTGCTGVEARNAILDLDNVVFGAFSLGTQIVGANGADINITCASCPPKLTFSGSAAIGISLTKNAHLTWGTNTNIVIPNVIAWTNFFLALQSGSASGGGPVTPSGAGLAGTTGTQCIVLTKSDLQITGGMPAWPGTASTCTPRPGSQQIVSGSSATAVTAGTTAYVGLWGQSATASQVVVLPAISGTFKNLVVALDGSPGAAANTVVVTLRNQATATDTAVTCTITDPATSCSDATHSVAFSAQQGYAIKAVSSGGNAIRVSWGMEFDIP